MAIRAISITKRSQRMAMFLAFFFVATMMISNSGDIQVKSKSQGVYAYTKRLYEYSKYPKECRPFFFQPFYGKNITIGRNEAIFTSETEELVQIPDSIHFLNYNSHLRTARYLCSLESAMKNNPVATIYMYTPDPKALADELHVWRSHLPEAFERVVLLKMDYAEYFKDTPLEEWYTAERHRKSWWVDQNLGNAFRLAVLWKSGGTYLDLDIISVNPLKAIVNGKTVPMGRFIAREESEQLNNAALRFPREDPFLWVLMENFVRKFDGYTWANNGPFCITRTYKEKCSKSITSKSYAREPLNSYCNNLDILSLARFYPIHFRKTYLMGAKFEEQCGLLSSIARNGLGVHWWHKSLEGDEKKSKKTSRNSVIGKLFEVQCPHVVAAHTWPGLGFSEE